jgi:hypothetical protein
MFGSVIIKPIYWRGPESEAVIASGKRWLCQDWRCPARQSCAHHFGRSEYYRAMAERHPPLVMPAKEEEAEACSHYRQDRHKAWLAAPCGIPPVAK